MQEIDRLADLIRAASRILVFTGAGVSTASGIPDYRGPQGVWRTRTPVTFQDFVASPEARVRFWTMKAEGWEAFRCARPNAAHGACVRLERAGKLLLLVTQNIDGLHRAAGTSPERLVEIHGTESRIGCLSCDRDVDPEATIRRFRQTGEPPVCACGGLLKSRTISFGQALRPEDLDRASAAAAGCDLVLSLGSTLSVQPAALVPLRAAERGVPYGIVNRGETEHDRHPGVVLRIEGDVGEVMGEAVERALEGGEEARRPGIAPRPAEPGRGRS